MRRPHKIGIGRVLGALLDGLEFVITEVRPALRLHDFALNRVGNLARVPSMPQCLDVGTGHNLPNSRSSLNSGSVGRTILIFSGTSLPRLSLASPYFSRRHTTF